MGKREQQPQLTREVIEDSQAGEDEESEVAISSPYLKVRKTIQCGDDSSNGVSVYTLRPYGSVT